MDICFRIGTFNVSMKDDYPYLVQESAEIKANNIRKPHDFAALFFDETKMIELREKALLHYLKTIEENNMDLIFLQETKDDEKLIKNIFSNHKYEVLHSRNDNCMLIFNKNIFHCQPSSCRQVSKCSNEGEKVGTYVICDLVAKNTLLRCVNGYFDPPNNVVTEEGGKEGENLLADILREVGDASKPLAEVQLIGGNFNVHLSGKTKREKQLFERGFQKHPLKEMTSINFRAEAEQEKQEPIPYMLDAIFVREDAKHVLELHRMKDEFYLLNVIEGVFCDTVPSTHKPLLFEAVLRKKNFGDEVYDKLEELVENVHEGLENLMKKVHV